MSPTVAPLRRTAPPAAADAAPGARAALPPGWAVCLPRERCNFHHQDAAAASFAGTPLCARCARHVGWPGPPPED